MTGAADASVRVAWPADAAAIAAVQLACWRHQYHHLVPSERLADTDEQAVADRWRDALTRPPDARNRVLVALADGQPVGFAATGPATDPDADPVADAEVTAFHVDPGHTRQGHGSRLLNAVVDTLRSDGFSRATAWVFAGDDTVRAFLASAGWEPDGAHRELDLDGTGSVVTRQVRLHSSLEET